MTDYINARERHRSVRATTAPGHKFDVGSHVSYKGGPASGLYSVSRRLPDSGQGLQYRIRSDRDGQERVVIESALERVP
jgi:hypothetical protein